MFKKKINYCLAVLLVTFSAVTFAQGSEGFQNCPQFFVRHTFPHVSEVQKWKPRALCYDAFAILYSGVTKTPLYVVERLSRKQLVDARDEKRTNRFFADARLPIRERAQLEDYKASGYDRGHMAPAADMPTAQAMAQSFSLANMVPQAPQNNRKAWAKIEEATRKYVLRAKSDIYVFSGPVFEEGFKTIGPGKVAVPKYLFKLVYDPSAPKAWAHWIENTNFARIGHPITYDELAKRTGITFLPE